VAASACLTAAGLAATQPVPDVRPRDTSANIERALELERSGAVAQAEFILLEAARLDRQYLPAWTLTNFYFRRNAIPQFWSWAARASALTRDPRALLRLANAAGTLWRSPHLGNRPEILRPYLDILVTEPRLADAQTVAALLRAHHDASDLPRFAALQQRLERQ
jgi:hypothetical protein